MANSNPKYALLYERNSTSTSLPSQRLVGSNLKNFHISRSVNDFCIEYHFTKLYKMVKHG